MKFDTIAVLGSNSFAGSAFISNAIERDINVIGFNRSAEGHEIFLPYKNSKNKSNYKFIQADLNSDYEMIVSELELIKPQVIIDFAGQGMVAESWQHPLQWYQTNILAKVRLHEFLRNASWLFRYVRISTPEVYGSQENLIQESLNYKPSTPYAISHAAIDMSLRAYFEQYDFPVIFNRFANFYGPGQQLYRIIPRSIIYGLSGRKLQLHGGGTSVRAFIHCEDVANAIFDSLEHGKTGSIYHFSSENFISIKSLIEKICIRMGVNFDDFVEVAPDRPGKDHAYLMDSTLARKELRWKDNIKFEDGIDQTINWIKNNINSINDLPLNYIHKP